MGPLGISATGIDSWQLSCQFYWRILFYLYSALRWRKQQKTHCLLSCKGFSLKFELSFLILAQTLLTLRLFFDLWPELVCFCCLVFLLTLASWVLWVLMGYLLFSRTGLSHRFYLAVVFHSWHFILPPSSGHFPFVTKLFQEPSRICKTSNIFISRIGR